MMPWLRASSRSILPQLRQHTTVQREIGMMPFSLSFLPPPPQHKIAGVFAALFAAINGRNDVLEANFQSSTRPSNRRENLPRPVAQVSTCLFPALV
jgi:hypothetical protein